MKHLWVHHKRWQWRWIHICILALMACPAASAATTAEGPTNVKITNNIPYLDLKHTNGKTIRLERVQDPTNVIDTEFGRTSRPCPPFCILPISLGPRIETVGELEVIDALRKISAGNKTMMVIDARTPNWLEEGAIPGAVSMPWKKFHLDHTSEGALMEVMEFELGVVHMNQLLNFENAKTLIIYCNGNWCGQSATVIRSLRTWGYPEHKLKWYRGGIQAWKMLGLTLVLPDGTVMINEGW